MITTTNDIINTILAGGLLGILGQGIRMAIGLKKLSDSNIGKVEEDKNEVNLTRLGISLFIGFTAGALFLIIKETNDFSKPEFIFSVVAAGYAGTDFIEGLFNTYISKIGTVSIPATPLPPGQNPVSQTPPATTPITSSSREDDHENNL